MLAVLLLGACSGCLGYGTVRAALIELDYALGPDAPEGAFERTIMVGCAPGEYDERERVIHLLPREDRPKFVQLQRNGDRVIASAFSGGSKGIWPPVLTEGGAGSSGWSTPWGVEGPNVEISFDGDQVWAMDEPLEEGVPWERAYAYRAAWENATFDVTLTVKALYLGRVPYDEDHRCVEDVAQGTSREG